jgi:hypothetical protein
MTRSTDNSAGAPASNIEPDNAAEAGTARSETAADDAAEIAPETAFDILRNSRRRLSITHLLETEADAVSLSDLAEHVASVENDIPRANLTSAQRKRVYVSLYQSHLPRMEEARAVTFDQDSGVVALGPQASAVGAYLDTPTESDTTYRCYGVITLVGTALLTISLLTNILSGAVVAGVVLLAVAGCTAARVR